MLTWPFEAELTPYNQKGIVPDEQTMLTYNMGGSGDSLKIRLGDGTPTRSL